MEPFSEHGTGATPSREPDDATTLDMPAPRRAGVVAGRYRIEYPLGSGGYGEVYRAYDELLRRVVSLKIVSLEKATGAAGAPEAALKEARTAAHLDHPNIVTVYDVGIEDNRVWMAMRLIEGKSLARILREEQRIEPARVLLLLRQAASALALAHKKGVIHRDVKPSNILLERLPDGGEHVWLVDFGIARMLTGGTVNPEASIAGTPSYMSPEQITGKRVDARADVFALGCVAHEMITGKQAFPGRTYAEVVYNVVHGQPAEFDEVSTAAGERFEALLRRALAKAPEERFQDAQEFLAALEALAGSPVAHRKRWSLLVSRETVSRPAQWDGRDAVVVNSLHKSYRRGRPVLNGISLSVAADSVYGLLGTNGSGKTTLIRTILGLYRQDSGSVLIFGRDPHRDGPQVLSRIGYVPETLAAPDSLRVGELVGFLRTFYPKWDDAYCYQLLARYQLPLDTRLRDLSKGMKTKVSLVAALAHRPEFLLMDDPTLGLDAAACRDVFETLQDASHREGTTALIASHNLDELETIATHIGFLKDGRLMLSDTLAGLRARTREVTLTFGEKVPDIRGIDQFKTVKATDTRVTGLVMDTSSGTIEQLRALAPRQMEVRELNLKELFVHLMR